MNTRLNVSAFFIAAAIASASRAADLEPISYTFSIKDPAARIAHVEATIPAGKAEKLELMMPMWTPGYYRKEDYAVKVREIAAKSAEGKALAIERKENRWTVASAGASEIVLSYDVLCDGRSVTGSSVGADMAVINPGSSLITLAEKGVTREHRVLVLLLPEWTQSISGLEHGPDGNPNHYSAKDYDTLVDSPIIAGNMMLSEFTVGSSEHVIADMGDLTGWDSKAAAANIEKFVRANDNFWSVNGGPGLPFKRYVFLNLFRQGAGGLEHMNSCLLSSSARNSPPGGTKPWLNYVSHEYFHAFNVKRFRPVELGPFDYEKTPSTPSLWISEGLTTYYGNLLVTRAGITTPAEWLGFTSAQIRSLQNTPGRLKQTLADASLTVFTGGSTSGVGGDTANTISYYGKGTVVGFVLDARIRRINDGKKSLDDVMREGLKRYGHPKPGFTPEQFVALCSEIAGSDMKEWFQKTLNTTEELDYTEALNWYGLRFAAPATAASAPATATAPGRGGRGGGANSTAFTLEVLPNASEAQKAHLAAVTAPDPIRAAR